MKYPRIIDRKCKHCNNDIIAKRSRDLDKQFCGPACVGKFFRSKEKELITCLFCSKQFAKTAKTKNMYCCVECYYKSKIKNNIKECKRCGAPFRLKNIAFERRGGGIYCSKECSTRCYEYDDCFFDKIDSELKAYWLGFICADGGVYRSTLILHTSIKDIEHIEKFKKHIKSNHPIYNGKSNSIFFNIHGEKIVKQLLNIGVTPRKTFTLEFPTISQELNSHFIRGYFDGDGCLYVRKDNHKVWSIYTSSVKFKDVLIDVIENDVMIKVRSYRQGNGYQIAVLRQSDVNKLYNYLYGDATIFLERKKNKFTERRTTYT